MKNVVVLAILAALAWYGDGTYKAKRDSTARTGLFDHGPALRDSTFCGNASVLTVLL